MTLEANLVALATAIGKDIGEIKKLIGDISQLDIANQDDVAGLIEWTNILAQGAIEEMKDNIGSENTDFQMLFFTAYDARIAAGFPTDTGPEIPPPPPVTS